MDISALYKCFTECGKVTTDSRNCPEGSMFIALKGKHSMEMHTRFRRWKRVASMP